MEKRSDTLPLWLKSAFAILPGIAAISNHMSLRYPDSVYLSTISTALLLCNLFLLVTGFIYERRFPVWSFPALGILLAWVSLSAGNSFPLVAVWLGIVSVLVARWLWSFKYWEASLLGLLLLGLLLIFLFPMWDVPESPELTPTQQVLSFVTLPMSALSMLSILPGIVGLFLARRTGVLAALVFVGSAHVMWEMIGDPEYALLLYTDSQALELIVSLHPHVFFLILVPIATMFSSSTKAHWVAFLLPIATAFVSAAAIASSIIPHRSSVHSIAYDSLGILLPLAIFMIVYARIGEKNQAVVDSVSLPV